VIDLDLAIIFLKGNFNFKNGKMGKQKERDLHHLYFDNRSIIHLPPPFSQQGEETKKR